MTGSTSWHSRYALRRLTAIWSSHACGSSSTGPPGAERPTLLTRTSMRPKRSTTRATEAATCSGSVTSHASTSQAPPSSRMIRWVSAAASRSRSTPAIVAPWRANRTEIVFPLPHPGSAVPHPVTSATLPSSLSTRAWRGGRGRGTCWPRARVRQRVVLDHRWALEHRRLLAVRLEAIVGERPDAGLLADLAEAVLAGPAARAVALVLRALRLRAEVGDVGQRAVATVAALEHRALRRLLGHVQRLADDPRRPLGALVERPAGAGQRGVVLEGEVVHEPADLVAQRRAAAAAPLAQRLRVPALQLRRRQPRPGVALVEVPLALEVVLHLAGEGGPVGLVAVRRLEDRRVVLRLEVAAEIRAAEAHAARDRHLARREVQRPGAALVRRRAVALHLGEQLG